VSQVIIVGGGIAGLSAAFELHRRGISFTLLEAGGRAGGVVLSEQIDGFTIDAGPDALLVQKPEAIRLCEELGLKERLVATKRPRVAYIQRDGRLHPLPAASVLGIPTKWGPFIRTPLFSWSGKLRMGMELAIAKHAVDDESIGAFMERRFGTEAKEYLAEPLLAGIHAGDVDRLSLRALFPRFVEVERTHGSLLRGFRKEPLRRAGAAGGTASTEGDDGGVFRSLSGGLSELITALVRALPAESIRLRTPATAVSRDESGYRVATGAETLGAESVLLASPAFVTARIVRSFDATLAELCEQVPYASTATIALAFPRSAVAHPLNGSGFVVPRVERTGILAASWLSSKWPGRAPDGRVLMRTFVGGARDPKGVERDDDELVALSIDALRRLLGISGEPLFSRVYRWERASAQHEVGHIGRLARIEEALARHPGLFVTGSGFRGVGIPDCVADGRATAAKVDAWLKR
jgi:oxygen-dependent protoporphyrinogen oxidase